jgi:2-oxoisovalerate dehydrogenase E1 component alpha subunit
MPESPKHARQPEPNARLATGEEWLDAERSLEIYRHMARARAMEERMIQMSKTGLGLFWVGGPGEEAFGVCLGMQVNKGGGPAYDYLHLHYRNTAVLVPMGLDFIEGIRQMLMRATDVNSMGRNFVSHYARKHANIMPVSSVLEVQYAMAPGTAMVQKRFGGDGVSIVMGGDAGTAEGDFASCLMWSTRHECELPVLVVVTNNGWGISTSYQSQFGDRSPIDRAQAFGMQGETVDGNDPVASWFAIERGMQVCREERRPYFIEARVSRLYGHSSASGAMKNVNEFDCLESLERRLMDAGMMDQAFVEKIAAESAAELDASVEQALNEPDPTEADLYKYTYAPSKVDVVYPEDYTGLPE